VVVEDDEPAVAEAAGLGQAAHAPFVSSRAAAG
jgi:hypothetical protein